MDDELPPLETLKEKHTEATERLVTKVFGFALWTTFVIAVNAQVSGVADAPSSPAVLQDLAAFRELLTVQLPP